MKHHDEIHIESRHNASKCYFVMRYKLELQCSRVKISLDMDSPHMPFACTSKDATITLGTQVRTATVQHRQVTASAQKHPKNARRRVSWALQHRVHTIADHISKTAKTSKRRWLRGIGMCSQMVSSRAFHISGYCLGDFYSQLAPSLSQFYCGYCEFYTTHSLQGGHFTFQRRWEFQFFGDIKYKSLL